MNELIQAKANSPSTGGAFSTIEAFDHWQRVAKMIASSNIVPKNYQNNVANVMIAIELANRIGVSYFMVMQNLDIIQGTPSWKGSFVIAAINSCGRFEPLKFKFTGKHGEDDYGCHAYTKDMSGENVTGTKITFKMVKGEGWYDKGGSKWKTMDEQMYQYRAASFFGRVHAPDILNGMYTVDEVKDFIPQRDTESDLERLQELYFQHVDALTDEDKTHLDRVIQNKEVSSYAKAIKSLEKL